MTAETSSQPTSIPSQMSVDELTSQLQQDYDQLQQLFSAQPVMIQRFLETQAGMLAEAIVQNVP
ncbi:MAG: hypothetical protein WHV66_14095, partial [Anaerolineales bacterium]